MDQIRSYLPAVLVSLLYAAALAVVLSDPPQRGLAGLVVVCGLVTRRLRQRRRRGQRTSATAATASTSRAGPRAPGGRS